LKIFYFVQIVGLIGFLICSYGFTRSEDKKLKIFVGIGTTIIATHFYFMGAFSASVAALIASSRYLFAYKNNKKWNKVICLMYILFYIVAAYFTAKFPIDFLPLVAGVISTISLFLLKSILMRVGILTTSFLWLIHNVHKHSLGGIALEIMVISTNIFTIIKLSKDKKKIK